MSRNVRLPKTAAALAEALAVIVERPNGAIEEIDLRGRILGTDGGARRLFAIKPRRLQLVGAEGPSRTRGARARDIRRSWQGAPVDQWLTVQTPKPTRPVYVGTARQIYYRSNKHHRGRTNYVHDFEHPAPSVYRAGPNYYFVGGAKRVTGKGIEH